jgi:hypothetical protein
MAHRRLGQVQAARRQADGALPVDGVKDHEQVQVEPANINFMHSG